MYRARYRRGRATVIFGVIAVFVALLSAPTTRAAASGCHLQGDWQQTTAGQSSVWHISSSGQATETGLGSAHGTATLVGNVLTIRSFPSDPTFDGVFKWTLGPDCRGTGTLTFTNSPRAGQTLSSTVIGPPPTVSTDKFGVNFSAYAKNVKVLPPLIGAWQLGIAQISGSATITPRGTTGSFTIHFRPLPPKYPNEFHLLYATLGEGSVVRTAGGTKATFTVMAIRAAAPCVKGSTATLTVFHTQNRLSNKQYGDYVTLGAWSSPTCVTWVMGWTNENGGARTQPSYGGPPSGGQWAHVEIYALPR